MRGVSNTQAEMSEAINKAGIDFSIDAPFKMIDKLVVAYPEMQDIEIARLAKSLLNVANPSIFWDVVVTKPRKFTIVTSLEEYG